MATAHDDPAMSHKETKATAHDCPAMSHNETMLQSFVTAAKKAQRKGKGKGGGKGKGKGYEPHDRKGTAQKPFVPKFAAQADHGEPMQSADTPEPEQEAEQEQEEEQKQKSPHNWLYQLSQTKKTQKHISSPDDRVLCSQCGEEIVGYHEDRERRRLDKRATVQSCYWEIRA